MESGVVFVFMVWVSGPERRPNQSTTISYAALITQLLSTRSIPLVRGPNHSLSL